jgi:tetraacyldisaccharide 4'-kinase
MPVDEPRWWYASRPGLTARLLQPVSKVYGMAAAARMRRRGYRSRLPVICIGNLTVGGTGKTPLAAHIAQRLSAGGERPALLSRGYGGSTVGPHVVDVARDTAALVGDEPLLLASEATVVVSRDRAAGARAIETLGATVIVMDDGLQNPDLEKDLTLAVVDGTRVLGNGLVLPAGPLRAPLAVQLPRADALVLSGAGGADLSGGLQTYRGPVIRMNRHVQGPTGWLQARPWLAFAGIAHPERFFDTAQAAGAHLADRVSFPDHHAFTSSDAERLMERAKALQAGLLTTSKDSVRMRGAAGRVAELAGTSRALRIEITMSEGDRALLEHLLRVAMNRSRPSS